MDFGFIYRTHDVIWVPIKRNQKQGVDAIYCWGVDASGEPIEHRGLLAHDQKQRVVESKLTCTRRKMESILEEIFPEVLLCLFLEYLHIDLCEYTIGDYVDAFDLQENWYTGMICEQREDKIHVRFIGWEHVHQRWYVLKSLDAPCDGSFDAPFDVSCLASPGEKTGIYSGIKIL